MKKLAGIMVLMAGMAQVLYAQDNYAMWSYYRTIALNTTASGANVSSLVRNFPVLIRLTSVDSMVFKNSQHAGQDVRFAKYDGTHFPYQIERWDSTDMKAELWVLVDSVRGGDSVQPAYPNGYLTMYWGNGSAADSQNAAGVFNTANGFLAVWHLADLNDATSNNYALTNNGTAVKTAGMIDTGYLFNGTSQYLSVAGLLGSPGTVTMSCWTNATGTAQGGLVATGHSWELEMPSAVGSLVLEYNGTGYPAYSATSSSLISGKGWMYVTGVINPSDSFEGYYQNGAAAAVTIASGNMGTASAAIPYSGTETWLGNNPDHTTRYLAGELNEVRVENVARSAAWITLCYQNQQASQMLVVSGPARQSVTQPPALVMPANGATGQQTSVTFIWGSASGAIAYMLQLSTNSTFATTVVSQIDSSASASDSNLALGTVYYWRVAGVNNAGPGAWSSVWSFTTVITGVLPRGDLTTLKTDFAVRGDALVYSLASSGPVEISFSDLLGRRSALVVNRTQSAGRYEIGLNNFNLAPGQYLVGFKSAGFEKKASVMIAR